MKFIISLILCLFMAGTATGQESNPRLKNFRYGTGQSSWWTTPQKQSQPQVFYYPSSIRYYHPVPYYYTHYPYCRCQGCFQRRQQIMMWQLQMNHNRFFFQFRF